MKVKFFNRITDVWDYPKSSIYTNDIDEHFFDFLKCDVNPEDREIRLYIHVPFCKSFCYFCQFYKEPPTNKAILDDYTEALLAELKIYSESEYFKNCNITSVFFGGGDPACLYAEHSEKIMNFISENFTVSSDVSITMEGNVLSLLDKAKIEAYKRINVSRITFGIQTFNEELRKKLLIKPKISDIYALIDLLYQHNLNHYTFDLMYNLPDQTMDILKNDFETASTFDWQYIDIFSLNMYPNTVFFDAVYNKNRFQIVPSKSREEEMIRYINKFMDEHGYNQVTSVTYSKKETLPHSGLYHYLTGGQMLGVGPSARSYLAERGYRNICSLEKYITNLKDKKLPAEAGKRLTEGELETRNTVLFPTLLQIDCSKVTKNKEMLGRINDLIESGYLRCENNKYFVTDEGRNWIGNIQKHLYDGQYSQTEFKSFLLTVKNKRSAYNQDTMWIKKDRKEI